MTSATLEALMKVYGLLLREGWDEPDVAEADRPGDRGASEVEVEFKDDLQEYMRKSGKSALTWDELREFLDRSGVHAPGEDPREPAGETPQPSTLQEGRGRRRVS
jgi:hypothetical protein